METTRVDGVKFPTLSRRHFSVAAADVRDEHPLPAVHQTKLGDPRPGLVARAVPLRRDGVIYATDVLELDRGRLL